MLNLCNISYSYGSQPVLSGLTLRLAPGQMAAVVGPNGCGKTTLLKCVSGLLEPLSGRISLEGIDTSCYTVKERARKIAVVPQDTALTFDFRVAEAVLMGRMPYLEPWQRETAADIEAVAQAMERTGIVSLADRLVSTLSGGERQRMLLARALAQEPRLLLLDEPTSQLDITYQAEILGLLRSLNEEQGLTIMAVIHDLNLAVQYFDSFVLLGQGSVVAMGTAAQVITAENLARAYSASQARIAVSRHPGHHRPFVTVYPPEKTAAPFAAAEERLALP